MRLNRFFLFTPRIFKGECVFPYHPHIGAGYICEVLEQNKIAYDYLDMRLGYSVKDLLKRIKHFRPDIIGLSLDTYHYEEVYGIIRTIKRKFPNAKIIVGGPHSSILKEDLLRKECSAIDFGVVREGEETILELCKGKDPSTIKGLVFWKGKEVIFTGYRPYNDSLDKLPFPKYKKFELNKYLDSPISPKIKKMIGMSAKKKMLSIETTRGCPYNCIFCCSKLTLGQRVRFYSAKRIVDEVEYWWKRGYRIFHITDDNFTLNKKRAYDVCDDIEKRGLKNLAFLISCGIRGDASDKDLLKRMKEVGFATIWFGVEGGNDKMLKILKKGETIEQIEKGIKMACDLGYEVGLTFLIGSPYETWNDIEDSAKLAMKYPVEAKFYNLVPYPGTELYEWVKKNNYFALPPRKYLNRSAHYDNEPCFYTPELSIKQRKKAFLYLRNLRLSILEKEAHKQYGFVGFWWMKLSLRLMPIMRQVYNLSPSLYKQISLFYYKVRSIVKPKKTA